MRSTHTATLRRAALTFGSALALGLTTTATASLAQGSPSPVTSPVGSPFASPLPSASRVPIGRVDHPTGPIDVVLRMETGGGIAGDRFALIEVPAFTLYGDNTVVFRPNTVTDSGDPAPLVRAYLSVEQVDALLEYALGPGRLADAQERYLDFINQVADGTTTTFTLQAAGLDKSISVYALGMASPPSTPKGDDLRGMEQLAHLLGTFETQVEAGNVESTEPYQPPAYRAVLTETGPGQEGTLGWPWPELTLDDFPPLPDAPAIRVGSLTPEQAALVTTVPSGGSYGIPIVGPDGLTYVLQLRPLLPDDAVHG